MSDTPFNDAVIELAYSKGFVYDDDPEDDPRSEGWAALDYLDELGVKVDDEGKELRGDN